MLVAGPQRAGTCFTTRVVEKMRMAAHPEVQSYRRYPALADRPVDRPGFDWPQIIAHTSLDYTVCDRGGLLHITLSCGAETDRLP
jgi:hypothetical protein